MRFGTVQYEGPLSLTLGAGSKLAVVSLSEVFFDACWESAPSLLDCLLSSAFLPRQKWCAVLSRNSA